MKAGLARLGIRDFNPKLKKAADQRSQPPYYELLALAR